MNEAKIPPKHKTLVDHERLSRVKKRIREESSHLDQYVNKLISDAEKSLSTPLVSVMDKKLVPPSGDKHDYASLAKYYWPNPDTEDGLPYIRRDGLTNPEIQKYDVASLETLCKSVGNLSFAYYFTDDERYAEHATAMLRTWFIDSDTRMNPNLNFSQFKPGTDVVDGHGIIESHRFRWLPDAVAILEQSEQWSKTDTEKIKTWFGEYVDWLISSEMGKVIRKNPDNKGTWHMAQIVNYALFSDKYEIAKEFSEYTKTRIDNAIDPSGLFITETSRTRSLHYHMFHLQAFFDAAILAKHAGVDLFGYESPQGGSLRKALDYLLPYVIPPEKKWPYEQIDEIRYQIVEELLRRASVYYDEPSYKDLINKLPTNKTTDATVVSYFCLIEPGVKEIND